MEQAATTWLLQLGVMPEQQTAHSANHGGRPMILGRKVIMRNLIFLSIPLSLALACAGGHSVLGVPTVVSDTSYDVAPGIVNQEEVRDVLREEYPARFRDAGIGGSAVVLISVNDMGEVQEASLERSSGYGALDGLALELARILRFSPAQIGGRPIPVWVTVRINLVPPTAQPATTRGFRPGA